ncbi:plastid ribosomal protein L18 [Chloropicon primus]|uniref:Large ribosomal subunit protein uL18c n=1 Tax=Chloropicon primus TaxID=1764295 RepID=A0A5B8MQ84_9CHLO|nr:plastid ribosomal protein L18 [Chloropicon primus]UPR00761.1 plastid ribosomal protein L18 [Chloropicon primus]|mmetsp:Transcript_1387/g.3973  ORF Transcript_1387/g.3973 Transcript_1387/m.3973 type:complete len:141 (+) Transcript_1387:107-529(+)|eukprot:QDZ21550.1 plastid ribosomal protein L18 [Chloropicon primus]
MPPPVGTRNTTTCMAAKPKSKRQKRQQRHERQRRKIYGTEERPRLAVFRSNEHIYAQVIDDSSHEGKGHTLCACSTLTPAIRESLSTGANVDAATKVGEEIASKCKALNISSVVFDKGGFLYHGRVQAVAEAAREGGLVF